MIRRRVLTAAKVPAARLGAPMDALAAPFHLLALVLVVSGMQKLITPQPAADAMRTAGLPVPAGRGATLAGSILGAVEAATGLAAIAVPSAVAAAWLGAFYLALAAFVLRLRQRDATAGCGCFGSASTPPSAVHVVINVVAAGVAITAAAVGVPDLIDVVDEGIGVAVPYVVLLTVGAGLVLLAPTLLADLAPTRRLR